MSDPRITLIGDLLKPLDPVPTDEQPRLSEMKEIRVIIFDVYGTLLISGADETREDSNAAILGSLRARKIPPPKCPPNLGENFQNLIREEHSRSITRGHLFPDIEIREIWRNFLNEFPHITDTEIELLAIHYECRVNPVWPMPGFHQTLQSINERDIRLGILSNAQFMTPLLFPALTQLTIDEWGFDPAFCWWSYRERESKPSPSLFRKLADTLRQHGYSPGECLLIGNDMRNDITPASEVGLRTALFAGDARSLRKRGIDPTTSRVDLLITHLSQVLDCL